MGSAETNSSGTNWRLFGWIVVLVALTIVALYVLGGMDGTMLLGALLVAIFVALIFARVYAVVRYVS